MALRSVEIRNKVDELFDFWMLDRRGQNVRKGWDRQILLDEEPSAQ